MTIKELKEQISNLPDDMEIILLKNEEGNEHSPLSEVEFEAVYIDGKLWFTDWDAEDVEMKESEWEEIRSNPKVMIMIPKN
jgi:hypothetical protein